MVVVTFGVIDGLERRIGEVINRAADALLHGFDAEPRLHKSGGARIENIPFQSIPEMIVEHGPSRAALRPLARPLDWRRAARPRLAVNQKVRVDLTEFADDLKDRAAID